MKGLIYLIVCFWIIGTVFYMGFKYGKLTYTSKNAEKTIDAQEKRIDNTEELKNYIKQLEEKMRIKKNEECTFILNYPVRDKCL